MELFDEFKKYRIPEVHLTPEEWEKNYHTYSIAGLRAPGNNKEERSTALLMAAEDIIRIYLLQEAKRAQDTYTCAKCFDTHLGKICPKCGSTLIVV